MKKYLFPFWSQNNHFYSKRAEFMLSYLWPHYFCLWPKITLADVVAFWRYVWSRLYEMLKPQQYLQSGRLQVELWQNPSPLHQGKKDETDSLFLLI